MKNRLKKALKSFGTIALINLLYLNVSTKYFSQQVFIIALEVVKISNHKLGLYIDWPTLSKNTVEQVFIVNVSLPNMIAYFYFRSFRKIFQFNAKINILALNNKVLLFEILNKRKVNFFVNFLL
jgi:hypothetical protein